jgi:hypothetical protein
MSRKFDVYAHFNDYLFSVVKQILVAGAYANFNNAFGN